MAAATRWPRSMPFALSMLLGTPRQVFGERCIEGGGLRRIKRNQSVMRTLAHRGDERERVLRCLNSGKALTAAVNSIDRVENRDMHDGHRAAGPGRPELLAEDAGVTGRDRNDRDRSHRSRFRSNDEWDRLPNNGGETAERIDCH